MFARVRLTAASIGGPKWKGGGKKGGCGQENLQGRYPGGSGNGERVVHLTDGGLHWGHHVKGWEKKGSKAGKTYEGATWEGVAAALLQCAQQTASCIGGPMQNWEKNGGCSEKDLQGHYPGESGNGNTAVRSKDGGTHQGHYAEG
jgi:hypothetical protein